MICCYLGFMGPIVEEVSVELSDVDIDKFASYYLHIRNIL